jgi:glycosyltransferase involved in cell wall biosynthesis
MKSVSVVMATYNSIRTVEAALKSLREQDYDQKKIEILVADGGSKDGTIKVIQRYRARLIPERTGSPEKAKAIALKQAKNELVLFFQSDNVLPNKGWLRTMVRVLEKEPDLVGVYPWRYAWRKQDSSLNRYFALMGANDPVARFLGRADRQSYHSNHWRLSGEVTDKGEYFVVQFRPDNLPTLGDNGMLLRRKELMRAKVDEAHFFHIDVCWDLVNLGLNKFGVVKNTIIHDSGERFWPFIKKRYRYMKSLYLKELGKRRYVWGKTWQDKLKILAFVIYSVTLIGPLVEASWGFIKKPDLAWFWQPIMCFAMVIVYGLAITF